MTHSDIKTKFLIEYDKMNTTSSYPSLTDYEIATVLDKAYLATIANKLTGNNPRKTGFESDNKAIEDIRPLITTRALSKQRTIINLPQQLTTNDAYCTNMVKYDIPIKEWMYFLQGLLAISNSDTRLRVQLASHEDAMNFMDTASNKPWVPIPTIYIEGDEIRLLYDSFKYKQSQIGDLYCTYVKKPALFVKGDDCDFSKTEFELNDNVAQEVINLAIIMSAEIVESQRLSTKASISSFES